MADSKGFPVLGSSPDPSTMRALRQSPPGNILPMTGLIRSSTIELTTFPIAAPMMTATARASAFCFSRKDLKSFNTMTFPSFSCAGRDPGSARSRLLRPPRFESALDLPGVLLEVFRVNRQPVLGGITAGFGVRAFRGPRLFRQLPQEIDGVGPHHVHGRERQFDLRGVVIEDPGPAVLVVPVDDRLLLRHEIPDARRGVHLSVSAVTDDLVDGPLARIRAPLPGFARHFREGIAKSRGAFLVALDKGLALFRRVAHRASPNWRVSVPRSAGCLSPGEVGRKPKNASGLCQKPGGPGAERRRVGWRRANRCCLQFRERLARQIGPVASRSSKV